MMEEMASEKGKEIPLEPPSFRSGKAVDRIEISLLTGGGDKPYAFGLATELTAKGVTFDLVGSDDLDCPEFRGNPRVNFLNLRGDQRPEAAFTKKMLRVLAYYVRLIRYALTCKPKLFHILWNNKFEYFDRTLLMLYYKWLGKNIVLTVHNVNARRRDSRDSVLNRLTLRFQYHLSDHIFVHSEKMKTDLIAEFAVQPMRVTVIPFGINNAVPNTQLTRLQARRRLGIADDEKTILFFGNIAPYKGLEYLVAAVQRLWEQNHEYRLIIAGRPKNCGEYWDELRQSIQGHVRNGQVILKEEYIPDEDTEVYFKAADVLALPYRYIYQSGVLFLGYSFGLPVLAADVGPLKEEILDGETGFVFAPENPTDLARAIDSYFTSELFSQLPARRQKIIDFVTEKHSWDIVGHATLNVYANLLRHGAPPGVSDNTSGKTAFAS